MTDWCKNGAKSTTICHQTLIVRNDYFVKVIFDENKNKIWDTGNFLNRIQPEEVFHFKEEFVIRANWIIEEKIVVE